MPDQRPSFKQIALASLDKGFRVHPLLAGEKRPLVDDWPAAATVDPRTIESWSARWPDANCGLAATPDGTWTLDVDSPMWFMEACPFAIDTFMVHTGGGGLQIHFKQDDYSRSKLRNRALPNPKKGEEGEKTNLLEVKHSNAYGIAAGSLHPSGRLYRAVNPGAALNVAPKEFVDWICSLLDGRAAPSRPGSPVSLRKAAGSIEETLEKAGLKFARSEKNGKVFLNYHVEHGRCLVAGKLHERNKGNNECSAFVYGRENREVWHFCQSCQEVTGQLKKALGALGLTLEDVCEPKWREMFSPMSEWKIEPPKEIVRELLVKGSIHAWAGLFASAKTMALNELASAILEKRRAFDHFEVLESHPILSLCLDMSPGMQRDDYAAHFRLHKNPNFFGINPEWDGFPALDDKNLIEAAKGKILALDTMLDWARLEDAFKSKEWTEFFERLRNLLKHGCAAIILLTHPTKTGARNTVIDATEFLKDSVTFGGKLDMAFAFRKVEGTSKVFVQRIKGRGYKRPITFTLTTEDDEGNSWIDRGRFPVCDAPGDAGSLSDQLSSAGKGKLQNLSEEQVKKLKELFDKGLSLREIARQMGDKSHNTVRAWLEELGLRKKKRAAADQGDLGI